jgi:hypothetical protein
MSGRKPDDERVPDDVSDAGSDAESDADTDTDTGKEDDKPKGFFARQSAKAASTIKTINEKRKEELVAKARRKTKRRLAMLVSILGTFLIYTLAKALNIPIKFVVPAMMYFVFVACLAIMLKPAYESFIALTQLGDAASAGANAAIK